MRSEALGLALCERIESADPTGLIGLPLRYMHSPVEVVDEAMKVVDAAGVDYEAVPFDLGGSRYLRDGVVLEQEHLE